MLGTDLPLPSPRSNKRRANPLWKKNHETSVKDITEEVNSILLK